MEPIDFFSTHLLAFDAQHFSKNFNPSECQIQYPTTCSSSAHLKQFNGSNLSVLIQQKTIQVHLENFKVKQGFITAMEWESLSCPYGRCAHIQNYIDGLQCFIYHQTIPVQKNKETLFH
jgi:hypothetical protein